MILAALASAAVTHAAETIELREGGRITGSLIREGGDASIKRVETRGGRIELDEVRVLRVEAPNKGQQQYAVERCRYGDSAAEQWKLSEWCRENGLPREREASLLSVMELEPDNAQARSALGFSQVDGQWATPEEWQRGRGYVLYRGRWRLAQDVQLLEERRRREQAEAEWLVKLRRWRADLGTSRGPAAYRELLLIDDGYAVNPVSQMFFGEPLPAVRRVYVRVLGKLAKAGRAGAVDALMRGVLLEPHIDVRYDCVDFLVELKPVEAVPFFIKALAGNDNHQVNRAAYALGMLGDDSAVEPLIAALITTHTFRTTPPGRGSADSISTSFSGGESAGAQASSAYPTTGTNMTTGDASKIIRRQVPNQDVLTALVKLAEGSSFGFDQRAWRLWLAAERRTSSR